MEKVVATLRQRFQHCRGSEAPLATWRELQLDILAAARSLPESRESLWDMLGDAFWIERDVMRLTSMIDDVITALEQRA